ncbi:hypothetical protein ABZ494_05890 [Nocardia amamiensis]
MAIGTFTGYSTLCMARALPPGRTIVTCDISEKWPMIAAATGSARVLPIASRSASVTRRKRSKRCWRTKVRRALIWRS